MIRDLLKPLAELLIANFLIEPVGGTMPTRRFLPFVGRLQNMQATFADEFRFARRAATVPSPPSSQ